MSEKLTFAAIDLFLEKVKEARSKKEQFIHFSKGLFRIYENWVYEKNHYGFRAYNKFIEYTKAVGENKFVVWTKIVRFVNISDLEECAEVLGYVDEIEYALHNAILDTEKD